MPHTPPHKAPSSPLSRNESGRSGGPEAFHTHGSYCTRGYVLTFQPVCVFHEYKAAWGKVLSMTHTRMFQLPAEIEALQEKQEPW